MFAGWLLTLAYPYGFASSETGAYENLARMFRWSQPNSMDWLRTFPYGLIVQWSPAFSVPSLFSFWVCTFVFSVSIGLVYVLGRCLFSSRALAAFMALAALTFELVSMHVFFQNLRYIAEPFVAVLVHTGSLLALIGWLRRLPGLFIFGYGLMGIAAFTKPEAISPFFVWIPFALALRTHWSGRRLAQYAVVVASIGLLVGPLAFLSMRNFSLYGCAKTSACGGIHFLQSSLHLVEDEDVLFDDLATNRKFIDTLRAFDKAHNKINRLNVPVPQRCWTLQQYLWSCRFEKANPPSPLDVIAQVVAGNDKIDFHVLANDTASMFKVESEATRVGMRIVAAHPWGFLRQVLREYADLWTPSSWWADDFEQYYADPRIAYAEYQAAHMPLYYSLYRDIGCQPNANKSNISAGLMFGKLNESVPLGLIVACLTTAQPVLALIIFIGAAVCLAQTRVSGSALYKSERAFQISVILILLYVTQVLHFALVAPVHVQRYRYGLIGDMGVHLMFIITMCALIPAILRRLAFAINAKIEIQDKRITAILNLPSGSIWLNTVLFAALVFLALFPSYLISGAYPYGLANAQTAGFVRLAQSFSWLCSRPDEWYASMPGVIVIALSSWFNHPSNWLFWLYSVMLAINIGLFFLVASQIFESRKTGTLVALAAILLEFVLMRICYFNLQIDSRPLFAHLSLAGGLLALLAWFQRSRRLCIGTCAVLGIASISQLPEGFALLGFWSVCFLIFGLRLIKPYRKVIPTIACCWLLLAGPVLTWSLRNLIVYGYPSACGCQGLFLLNHVLPLTRVDNSSSTNDEVSKLTTSESYRRGWLSPEIVRRVKNNSLKELHSSLTPDGNLNQVNGIDPDSMFVLNDAAYDQALRIIATHAPAFLRNTWQNYMQLFSSEQTNNPSIQYQSNPEIVYARNKDWLASFAPYHDLFLLNYRQRWIDSFYQRLTTSNIGDCDPAAVTILGLLDACIAVRCLRAAVERYQFLTCHLILLAALFIMLFKNTNTIIRSPQLDKLAVSVLLILLPSAINLFFAASTISASYPYLIESELGLHLTVILAICGAILLTRAQWIQRRGAGQLSENKRVSDILK